MAMSNFTAQPGNGEQLVPRVMVFAATCTLLFAVVGGVAAVTLDALAPGYYPAVFPRAREFARLEGVITGIVQGLFLSLPVGAVLTVGLICFRQMNLHACALSLAVLTGSVLVCACGGGLAGVVLSGLAPGYYRNLFEQADMPAINPRDVGIGLGCSQGMIFGVVAGLLLALLLAWRRARIKRVVALG